MSAVEKPEPRVGTREWLESLSVAERLPVARVWAETADKAVNADEPWTLTATLVHLRWAVAELAKYVGHEPTVAEEMAYLNRCLNAVHGVCDEAEKQATRWEHPLPVPEWVATVREAASGERTASSPSPAAGDKQPETEDCQCGPQMRCPNGHCSRHYMCQDCGNCCSCECAGGAR